MIFSRIYERYLAKQIYLAGLFILLAFVALFVFFDLLNALSDVGQAQYSTMMAVFYVGLQAPIHFYEILPLAALIGSIYVFAQLANHSEFTIFRLAGLSRSRALWSAFKIGIPIVLVTYLVGEFLGPYSAQFAERLKLKALGQTIATGLRSGLWVKDKVTQDGRGNRFVNIRSLQLNGNVNGIDIFEFDNEFRLRSITQATTAEYKTQGKWLLKEVKQTFFHTLENKNVLMPAHKTELKQLAELEITSELTPQILEVLLVSPDRMALIDLFLYVRHLDNNKQDSQRYEIALWKKLVYPLTVLVMMVLALPFAYLHVRESSIGFKVFGGIVLGMSFHLVNSLFSHLGQLKGWFPPLVALSPAAFYLLLALLALYWVERH